MPISEYLKNLREHVGADLLLVPSVSAVLFDEYDRVLLAHHAEKDQWATLGGSIDPNESPANAIVREVWEEATLLVEPMRVIGIYGGPEFEMTYSNGDRVTYLMTVFECCILSGEMQPDGVEILELEYFSQSDLADLDLSPWGTIVLSDVFNNHRKTHFKPAMWRPPA